jgi:hypothetical protein
MRGDIHALFHSSHKTSWTEAILETLPIPEKQKREIYFQEQ